MRLAERLAQARGEPVEMDGQLVHMMYELPPITRPTERRISLRAGAPRPQALRLKARGGVVEIDEQALDDVVLWSDSAPPAVRARLVPASARKPMTVRLWNAWRDEAGTMQAWIGDAGLLVEEPEPGTVVLRCSDGYDAPRFDDLVVTLSDGGGG